MLVKIISQQQTLPLRKKVLRPNQPIESCYFSEDKYIDTFHLGVFVGGEIVSTGTFCRESSPHFTNAHQYRLRGMATAEGFRGLGCGALIVREGERLILGKHQSDRRIDHSHGGTIHSQQAHDSNILIWFNAREAAFGFYQKLGYEFHGELFQIPISGPHKVMFRKIS